MGKTLRKIMPKAYILVPGYGAQGGIGAFLIGGERVGTLSGRQPEGCLSYWSIASALYNNRVLCDVAVRSGASAILHTESRLFASLREFRRVEVEGYGVACVK